MGYEASDWAWDQSCPLAAKLVLVRLAHHANRNFQCWPSAATIATATGLSLRAVKGALKDLERNQLLHIERRQTTAGRNTTNFYTLRVTPATDGEVQHLHPRGAARAPSVVQHVHHPSVHHVHPNLSDMNQPTESGQQFEIFWKEYPSARRGRKDYAGEAWQEAVTRAIPETILAGLRRFKFSADPTQVPFASRWLTLDGWTDTTIQAPPPHPPPSPARDRDGLELTLDDLAESVF